MSTAETQSVTKAQGTGIIYSLYRGFVISRLLSVSIYFTITWVQKIVRCTEDFVLWRFAVSRFHWIKEGTGSHYCVNNDQMCQDFVVSLREVALTRARQCYWGNPVFLAKSRA